MHCFWVKLSYPQVQIWQMHFSSFLASEADDGFLLASDVFVCMLIFWYPRVFSMQNRELWVNVELEDPKVGPQWCSKPEWTSRCAHRASRSTIPASLRMKRQIAGAKVWIWKGALNRIDWFFILFYYYRVSYGFGLEISEIWGHHSDLDIVVILPFKRWGWHCFRLIWKMGKDGHIFPAPGHEDASVKLKMWRLFQKFRILIA